MNEGIREILNLFIFFLKKYFTQKKHKTHTSEQKRKRQHFYVRKEQLRGRNLPV